MSMNLTQARALVRQFAKNAGDSTMYSDSDVDRAIQACLDDFLMETRCTRTSDTVDLAEDDYDYDLTGNTDFATFLPERLIAAHVDNKPNMERPSEGEIRANRDEDDSADTPTQIAFTSPTAFVVYPTPDDTYTLTIEWWQPLVAFEAGIASPNDVTLNLDDTYARTALMYGGPAFLQANQPEYGYAAQSYQKYTDFRSRVKGAAGSRGVRSITRNVG